MVNLVETLFGIAILTAIIAAIAFVQSKNPGEKAPMYRARMRRFFAIAGITLVLALVGEVLLRVAL